MVKFSETILSLWEQVVFVPWILSFLLFQSLVVALPELGRWTLHFNSNQEFNGIVKNVFANTGVYVKIQCTSELSSQKIKIGWVLRETKCWNEYIFLESQSELFPTYYMTPEVQLDIEKKNGTTPHYVKHPEIVQDCNGAIFLDVDMEPQQGKKTLFKKSPSGPITNMAQYSIPHSGDYLFVIHMDTFDDAPFTATATVEIKGPRGYLSVTDWPLLPFYGVMCGVYVILGISWLILCSRHWRDLLRIQFWIGSVIFLGMLEKAMFLAEYSNISNTGTSTQGLILVAGTYIMCKKDFGQQPFCFRMLVIIVSLGFGIVKPRLGPTLQRVLGIGGLYFIFASTEASLRVTKAKNDTSSLVMIAGIPLAIIDSSICWWVFSALVQTTRTLRLRRNAIKLTLYRHFTNTLILSVIGSVTFMLWSIKYHKLEECLIDWRDLWIEDAFWHFLFSMILCVIMFLWRPSQNNQRYAFASLLDCEDDEESENDDSPFYKDKVTMRNISGISSKQSPREIDDDPMKWIEDNIPESETNPLPIVDSEEEIETTKFEISKMH